MRDGVLGHALTIVKDANDSKLPPIALKSAGVGVLLKTYSNQGCFLVFESFQGIVQHFR